MQQQDRSGRAHKKAVAAALVALLLPIASGGCGGGSPSPTATPTPLIAVTLVPASAQLLPAQTRSFSASVTGSGNQQVVWSVLEGLAGGSVTESGLYTAPGLAGTYHVVATSRADLSKNALATITVRLSLSLAPSAATLTLGETRLLSATVTGSLNQGVSWSIVEGAAGGSVSATGLYTAPASPGVYHVVATSLADPQQSASATLTVQAGSASGTIE